MICAPLCAIGHVRVVQRAQHEAGDQVDGSVVRQRLDHRPGGGFRLRGHECRADLRGVPAVARRPGHADRWADRNQMSGRAAEPPRVQLQHAQGPGHADVHKGELLLLRRKL